MDSSYPRTGVSEFGPPQLLEKQLKHHLPGLHTLFEFSPSCLKLIDGDGKLLAMNRNGCKLMDIDDFAALEGCEWSSLWPEPELVKRALEGARLKGSASFQAFCPTARQTPKWWDVQITRVQNGSELCFLSDSRDITQLKQTEASLKTTNEALRTANAQLKERAVQKVEELSASNAALVDEIKQRGFVEKEFRLVFEGAPTGITLTDATGKLLETNGTFCDMLGYEPEELRSLPVRDLVFPDDLERHGTAFRRLIKGEVDALELERSLKAKDGRCVKTRLFASALRDERGEVACIIAHFIDRTEELNAALQMANREAELNAVLDTMGDGLVVQNLQGEIIKSNARAEAILGLTKDQLLGKTSADDDWRAIREDGSDLSADEHYSMRCLATGEAQSGVMGVHKPSGELTWILVNSAPLKVGAGERKVVSSFTDVTKMRTVTTDLEEAVQRLERSNRDLQDFAYIASHDLQEPLRMVSSYVQLLARRYSGKLDADAEDFIKFAVDGSKRMQTLINDLLAYSRIGSRGRPLKKESSHLLLEDALDNLTLKIEESDAQITYGILPEVTVDSSQVISLFQNLLDNAIKYCSGPPAIDVNVEREEHGTKSIWHFSVTDNGIGLDPDNLERIFSLFARLHSRDAYPGSGVGLTVCRRIVERHGGSIWAESLPKGARFHFTLPA